MGPVRRLSDQRSRSEKKGEPGSETTGESSWQTMFEARLQNQFTLSSSGAETAEPRPLQLRLSPGQREQHRSDVICRPSSLAWSTARPTPSSFNDISAQGQH